MKTIRCKALVARVVLLALAVIAWELIRKLLVR
jgi:hypothetical protein